MMKYLFILLFPTCLFSQQVILKQKVGGVPRAVYTPSGTLPDEIDFEIPDSILGQTYDNGRFVNTRGFYAPGDGGGATYLVQAAIPSGLQNDTATVIALAGGNYAVLADLKNINVLSIGWKKDSTLIAAHIVSRAQRLANLGKVNFNFPSGTYNLAQPGTGGYIFTVNGVDNITFTGEAGSKIKLENRDTATDAGFLLLNNCRDIILKNMSFQGNPIDTSWEEETRYVVTCSIDVVNIEVKDCKFQSITPVVYNSSRGHDGFLFSNCFVNDAPGNLNPPDNTIIENCRFENDTTYGGRSHAVYSFGGYNNVTITNCSFKNITGYAFKFRAESGRDNFKRNVVFSNNICHNASKGIDLGTNLSDIALGSASITGNTFYNTDIGVQLYQPTSVTIAGNNFIWAFDCTDTAVSGIAISGGSWRDTNPRSISITGNTIEDLRNVMYKFKLNALPANNDTLKVGTILYTFKTTPTLKNHIQVSASIADQVEAINDKLRHAQGSGGLAGLYLNGIMDVRCDRTDSTVILNLRSSQTITTNLNITYLQNGVDYRGAATGIAGGGARESGLIVMGNTFRNLNKPINGGGHKSIFSGNVFSGAYSTVNIDFNGSIQPTFSGNIFDSLFTSSAYRIDIRGSFFPFVANNTGMRNFEFANAYYDMWAANQCVRTAGQGKAEAIFYWGAVNPVPDSTQFSTYWWNHNDSIQLLNGETVLYTFYYKAQGALGATGFNTKTSLISLINATTEFDAVDPKAGDDGVFRIQAASAGTAGNSYNIRVFTESRYSGLTLGEDFVGGSASADVTVFWTPMASNYNAPSITALNSATAALGAYCDFANSKSGKYYLIKHSAASGTDKFYFTLN